MQSNLNIIKSIILLLALIIFSCNKHVEKTSALNDSDNQNIKIESEIELKIDSIKLNFNLKPKGNYTSTIEQIKTDKSYFQNLYQSNRAKAIDSAATYLHSRLLNDIVPHWYGIPWDFNGHTNIPNDGEIACGYLVSTTLKHLGFNLNRYKMAQAAGLNEAKLLQPKSELKIYSGLSFQALKQKVNSAYTDGIYFVGLDNHVGYVVIKDKTLYFLHSSYCDDKVVVEYAETAACFASNIYVFAEITTNKTLVANWITNKRLNIPQS